MKKWTFTLCFGLATGILLSSLLVSPISAAARYNLDDFEESRLSGGAGLSMVDGQTYLTTGFSPNLKFKGAELGFDLNLHIPLASYDSRPDDLQIFTFRHIGYNYKDKWGARWGRLSNVTFGYGLLMDNYDSGSGGSSTFSNSKAGLLGFATMGDLRADAMYTASKMQAARLSYRYPVIPVINMPIVFGATIVNDDNGVDDDSSGSRIQRPSQMGYGLDVGIPVAGDLLTVYSELAKLDKSGTGYGTQGGGGKGATVGAKGNVFNMVNYIAEFRRFERGFIPGYFNSTYEATSFDFENNPFTEAQSGFLVGAYTDLMDGYVKAGATYEHYKDQQMAVASLGWKKIANTVGVLNYTIPIQGRQNAILEADVLYFTGGLFNYVIHFKRVYTSTDTYNDSYSVGVRMNMDSFIPSF